MKNFYKILGVDRNVSEEEIKKAYRRLAHKYHPDKPGGDESKFKEINEAYSVLSNKEKRSQYDRFGTAFEGGAGWQKGAGPFPFGDFADFGFSGAGFGNFEDIFEVFFGRENRRPVYRKGSDIEIVQEITLEEAMTGKVLKFNFETKVQCLSCGGRGFDHLEGFSVCNICGGKGEIRETRKTFFGSFSQIVICSACNGVGQTPNKMCVKCRGKGCVTGKKEVVLNVRAGVEDNQIVKVKGSGEAGEKGSDPGDLYVRIKIKPHSVFKRIGSDLIIYKDIDLIDILMAAGQSMAAEQSMAAGQSMATGEFKGKKIKIPTLKGKEIEIEIPPGFNLREDFIIRGEGITENGNLIVRFNPKTPKKSNPKLKKILENFTGE